ncbi:MAG: 50S ribosomal protein L7/L12 [Acidobacteria bacterium]|nr:MAG: 50S ribosomal protein L7/L12 [Acidobacteriota bacterium]
MTKEDVKSYLKAAPMLEVAELVKELEAEFGVSAAAAMPVMMAGAPGAGAGAAAVAEVKDTFDVVLTEVGDNTSLGLKEAKDLVDGAPKTVKEGVSKTEAEEIKKKFGEAGAKVELK